MTEQTISAKTKKPQSGHRRLSLGILGLVGVGVLGWSVIHFGDVQSFALTLRGANPFGSLARSYCR